MLNLLLAFLGSLATLIVDFLIAVLELIRNFILTLVGAA